jgi:two-component system response regulator YesN
MGVTIMNMNVLVVEDESSIRCHMCEFIQSLGEPFSLLGSARNGLEALDYFNKHTVHILLTDIRMPQMDGIALIEKIHQGWPETHVIILSGYNDFKYAKQAIKFGVKDYLLKPLKKQELVHTLVEISDKAHNMSNSYASLMLNQEKWSMSLISLENQMLEQVEIGNIRGAKEGITALLEAFWTKVGGDQLKVIPFVTDTILNLNKRVLSFEVIQIPLDSQFKELRRAVKFDRSFSDVKEAVTKYVVCCATAVKEYRKGSSPDVLFRCKEILKDHFMQNITLNEMAELVNVTPSYLSRLFKKEVGINYIDYIHCLRLDKAKNLLSNNNLKIMEVSKVVGYMNAYYFTRVFKKKFGITPEEFRKKLENAL